MIGRALRGAGSLTAIASLAGPLVLVVVVVEAGRVGVDAALRARSVWIWAVALAVSIFLATFRAVRERRFALPLGLLALVAVLAQPLASWAWHFEGTVRAVAGEAAPPWDTTTRSGALAEPPAIAVLDLPALPDGPAVLRFDGRDVTLPLGRETRVGARTSVTVHGPYPAPSFEVLARDGSQEAAGLLKLEPEKREHYLVGVLPHRFYLDADPKGATAGDLRNPQRLHLRIQRGKLRILERDIAPEERVEFEGLSFAYGQGDVWARVDVRRDLPRWPGFSIAAGLALAALGIGARGRRIRS